MVALVEQRRRYFLTFLLDDIIIGAFGGLEGELITNNQITKFSVRNGDISFQTRWCFTEMEQKYTPLMIRVFGISCGWVFSITTVMSLPQ